MIRSTRSLMALLGYAGLLPFYASASWLLLPAAPAKSFAADLFVTYGVVILAFLGGTLWGNAVTRSPPVKYVRLVLSNAMALFAAAAGLVGSAIVAAVLLALGQLALLFYERATGDRGGWYLALRTRLTLGVMPAHVLYVVGMWG